jgi:hypothetical protein
VVGIGAPRGAAGAEALGDGDAAAAVLAAETDRSAARNADA